MNTEKYIIGELRRQWRSSREIWEHVKIRMRYDDCDFEPAKSTVITILSRLYAKDKIERQERLSNRARGQYYWRRLRDV